MAPLKGQFKIKNPGKYLGDPTRIIYRSSWEFKVMMQLDHDPNIVGWSSEEIRIAYQSPIDNRVHTYYPDFLIKEKQLNGTIKTKIIEVKPYDQTLPPKIPSTKTKRPSVKLIKEAATYAVNDAKWKSARKYCEHRGYEFVIITENELFSKIKK